MHLLRRLRLPVTALAAVLATVVVPSWWCGREADGWLRDDPDLVRPLARGVAAAVLDGVRPEDFATGSLRFDGEWALGTCVMAVIGLSNVALANPSQRATLRPAAESCLDDLLAPEVRRFGTRAWGEDPLVHPVDPKHGHAWLGYVGFALASWRRVDPQGRHAAAGDRIADLLAARLPLPIAANETYPGEAYPCDMAMGAGAVALHARATGSDRSELLADWTRRFREVAVDDDTGLLFQALDPRSGAIRDGPRSSGTGLAVLSLAWVDPGLSRELWQAVDAQAVSVLGFGAIREHPNGSNAADIDSGPVFFGVSVSATGFALAGARIHGADARFRALYRTAYAFGAPVVHDGTRHHLTGGPLGDAILLAMLTAPRASG